MKVTLSISMRYRAEATRTCALQWIGLFVFSCPACFSYLCSCRCTLLFHITDFLQFPPAAGLVDPACSSFPRFILGRLWEETCCRRPMFYIFVAWLTLGVLLHFQMVDPDLLTQQVLLTVPLRNGEFQLFSLCSVVDISVLYIYIYIYIEKSDSPIQQTEQHILSASQTWPEIQTPNILQVPKQVDPPSLNSFYIACYAWNSLRTKLKPPGKQC